jgi:hypothetical protein
MASGMMCGKLPYISIRGIAIMRYILLGALLSGLLATLVVLPKASASTPLSPDDVARLRKVIRPLPGEDPFETIPWETNLWEARVKAAAAGKPILLWEMDGHPLGCG